VTAKVLLTVVAIKKRRAVLAVDEPAPLLDLRVLSVDARLCFATPYPVISWTGGSKSQIVISVKSLKIPQEQR
jgi:hypothetical protein